MTGPQLEDGYLKIAVDLASALARLRLSGYQSRCLWFLIRKTYGWDKPRDVISLNQWVYGTGLKKSHVSRTLKELVERNIVTKNGKEYGLQKNPDKWIDKLIDKSVPKAKVITKNGNESEPSRVDKITKNGKDVTKNGNKSLPKMVTTKESYINTFSKDILAGVKVGGVDLLPQVKISIWFHTEQREKFPKYSLWVDDKGFVDTVARGAVTVEKMFRLDEWGYDELAELLKWVLEDYRPSFSWAIQMKSLAPIRDRKTNGQRKIENAKDDMDRLTNQRSGSGKGRTPAAGNKGDYAFNK